MCTEPDKEVTHAQVTNIPNDFPLHMARWEEDLLQSLNQAPVNFKDADVRHAMLHGTFFTEDLSTSFGMVIPLDRPYTTGSRTFPSHFVIIGPLRPKLDLEMKRSGSMISTKYVIHLLDEEEVEQLPRSKIQCVFRGITSNASVNQFMRQVVADYLREKGLYGRMAVVADFRHQVLSGMYTETILVVYLMRNPTDEEVRRGHELMGFRGPRKDFRHRGVVLDAYKTLAGTDSVPMSPAIRAEKPHLAFRYIRWINYETVVSRILQMIDINLVDYWYVATKASGQHIETVVGLTTVLEPRNLPMGLLREFVDMQPGAVRVCMRLPFQAPPPFLFREPGPGWKEQAADGPSLATYERREEEKSKAPRQPEFHLPPLPQRTMAPRPGPVTTPPRGWATPSASDITTVTSLGSRISDLELVMTTMAKESSTMVVSVQNQLRVEKEGRERLETECSDLRMEVEQLRLAARANEGAIMQMQGTMEMALRQMAKSQEESRVQIARAQEEARQEGRQQFQWIIDAVKKGPDRQGTHDERDV
jgi:hypothetical protein